jgi:hypothetical protein
MIVNWLELKMIRLEFPNIGFQTLDTDSSTCCVFMLLFFVYIPHPVQMCSEVVVSSAPARSSFVAGGFHECCDENQNIYDQTTKE